MKSPQKDPTMTTYLILWGMMFLALVIYGFLLEYKLDEVGAVAVDNPLLVPIFLFISSGSLLGAIYLPRIMVKDLRKQLPERFADPKEHIKLFGSPFIIRLALLESVGLFGFGLATITLNRNFFFPFMLISAVGFLMNYPSEKKVQEMLDGGSSL